MNVLAYIGMELSTFVGPWLSAKGWIGQDDKPYKSGRLIRIHYIIVTLLKEYLPRMIPVEPLKCIPSQGQTTGQIVMLTIAHECMCDNNREGRPTASRSCRANFNTVILILMRLTHAHTVKSPPHVHVPKALDN